MTEAMVTTPQQRKKKEETTTKKKKEHLCTMAWITLPFAAVLAGMQLQSILSPAAVVVQAGAQSIPAQAQVIDQKSFNVWPTQVPPSTVANSTQVFMPPGIAPADLAARPFHIYSDDFLAILGDNPTLTLLAETASDPLFHEAVVWSKATDEVFFVQNAGAPAAGTGLAKSAIIQKIALAQADAVTAQANASGLVDVVVVDAAPAVVNPNGATNYRGQIVYMAEGAGAANTSQVVLMNPRAPYNTTVLLDNYFGRQFSSLNDVAVHPRNKELYFTDTLYGFLQDFRPPPGLRNQVYRWNEETGAVTVVADGFVLPNGMYLCFGGGQRTVLTFNTGVTFSPCGKFAYVTDTGVNKGFFGYNFSDPATM